MKSAIRFLAVLCATAALPALADVEALYWQVTPGSGGSNPDGVTFTAASLAYTTDGGTTVNYLPNGSSSGSAWIASDSTTHTSTEVAAAILGDTSVDRSGWSFFIELQNYDETKGWYTAGRSDMQTYDQLRDYITTSSSLNITPTVFTPAVAIPEPTSGLLLLVGGALLALRRRRI